MVFPPLLKCLDAMRNEWVIARLVENILFRSRKKPSKRMRWEVQHRGTVPRRCIVQSIQSVHQGLSAPGLFQFCLILEQIQVVLFATRYFTICHFVFFNICLLVAIDPQVAGKKLVLHNYNILLLFKFTTNYIINAPNASAENYIPQNGGVSIASGHNIAAIFVC
jgi:hypothetical protein